MRFDLGFVIELFRPASMSGFEGGWSSAQSSGYATAIPEPPAMRMAFVLEWRRWGEGRMLESRSRSLGGDLFNLVLCWCWAVLIVCLHLYVTMLMCCI